MTAILFENDNLSLHSVPIDQSEQVVVTFSPRLGAPRPGPAHPNAGFGQELFRKLGISAFHVVAKWNHWWQLDEMEEVLQAIRDRRGTRALWTYGASMGGAGALMFADRLDAAGAIAMSPQASIDLSRADFDRRWMADRRRIKTFDDRWLDAGLNTPTWLFHDPTHAEDDQHARMITAVAANIHCVPVLFSDQAAMRMLTECAALDDTVQNLLAGKFNHDMYLRSVRSHRNRSPVALTGAARTLSRRGDHQRAAAMSGKAVALLEAERRAGRRLDAATATWALHIHTENLVRARKVEEAAALLVKLRDTPVVAGNFTRQLLQLALLTRNSDEVIRLIEQRLATESLAGPWFDTLISAINRNHFPPDQILKFHMRNGANILAADTTGRYAKAIAAKNLDVATTASQPDETSQTYRIEGDALLTKDNIAFLVGGNHSVLQYVTGKLAPTPTSLATFAGNLAERASIARGQGIPYLHVIFPDKQSVMTEAFPIGPVHRLGDAYLAPLDPGLRPYVLYPADRLRDEQRAPFLPLDTHMTDHGSLAVLRMMLSATGFQADESLARVERRIVKAQRWAGDLGAKFTPRLFQDGVVLDPDWPVTAFRNSSGFNDGLVDILISPEAAHDRTVLLFGDSFFRMMLQHLSMVFTRVICLRTRFLHPEMVTLIRPDVIYTGNAERYLSNVTADSEAQAFALYPHLRAATDLAMPPEFLAAWRAVTAPRSVHSQRFFHRYTLPRPA